MPRLPGSCRPAATTNGPSLARSSNSAAEKVRSLTRAATPWGVSLGTMELKSAFGRIRVSVRALIWGKSFSARGRADSLKNMLLRSRPLRKASSSNLTPSMAHSPLRSEFGAAEGHAQFFEPLIVAAGDGTQAIRLTVSSRGLRLLLHRLVPRSGCMVHFIVYTNNVYTDNVDTGEDTPMRA